MNGKIFSATVLVALAGLAGVALGTRPAVEPVAVNTSAANTAPPDRPSAEPETANTAPNAPRVGTSSSSTGGEEAEHENEHEFENGDDGAERDD